MRFAARALVVVMVLLSIFGARTSQVAARMLRASNTPTCACPHASEREVEACCCHHGDRGDQALPVDAGCSAHNALAPSTVVAGEIPVPLLTGIAAMLEVTPLRGQSLQLRLDRPPRV